MHTPFETDLSTATKAAIQEVIQEITANHILLLETIAGGPQKFRHDFLKALKGLAVNDDIANKVFYLFCQQHLAQYGTMTAAAVLDKIEVVSPPTEKEIEAGWKHDFEGSSDSARRTFYRDAVGEPITVRPPSPKSTVN